MKISRKTFLAIVLAICMVGTVLGVVLVKKELPSKIKIVGPELKIFDVDGVTELVLLDFGEGEAGQTIMRPIDYTSKWYYLRNTGNKDLYLYYGDNLAWSDVHIELTSGSVIKNGSRIVAGDTFQVWFQLRIPLDPKPPLGPYDFVITIEGRDA